jgi:hypothetical protein
MARQPTSAAIRLDGHTTGRHNCDQGFVPGVALDELCEKRALRHDAQRVLRAYFNPALANAVPIPRPSSAGGTCVCVKGDEIIRKPIRKGGSLSPREEGRLFAPSLKRYRRAALWI